MKEGSFLDDLDELNLGIRLRETLASSISFTLLSRCGADMDLWKVDMNFEYIHEFNNTKSLAVIGNATTEMCKPLLMEIGRAIGSYERQIAQNKASITCEPKAMEVIAELVAKLPEMEIDGVMSEDMEAMVWEKRMPDLGPAEQLAVEIDRFSYDYDIYSYRNNNPNMTESVSEISEMIVQGNTEPITDWLNEVISEGALPDEMQRTKVLLEKLAEYKPLAKIEEMEEQNYNMIDNVLNNGAEKAQREANKKNQEQSAVKVSLKARLAEKKAQVEGSGQEHEVQENTKKNQREI